MANYYGATPVTLADDTSGGNVSGAKPVYLVNPNGTPASLSASFVSATEASSQQLAADGVSLASPWQQFTTRSFRPPSKVISRFPSGHGWTGGTDDTTIKLFTDRTYKATSNGSGGNSYLSSPTLTAVNFSAAAIRVVFRVDNAARLAGVQINAKTDGSNIFQGSVNFTAISGEWVVGTVARSAFTSIVGTGNWASITALDLIFWDNGGAAPVTLNLAAFELIPDLAATYPSGVFILEADDGYAGQKTYLAPATAQRGIPVTYNPIVDRFTGGSPASGMTAADLRVFQDLYGWQMSCHAYAGTVHDANPATGSTLEQDFQRQKHWLHANGLHNGANHYAECPGSSSPVSAGTTMDVIRKSFQSARVNSGFFETATPSDPLRLRSILFSGQTNATLQSNIDKVAGAGGALIFTVHDVLTGSTNGTSNGLPAIAVNNLATVLDYAASKGMVFRTRADFIDGR